jgi:hypothetical protein
MSSKEPQPNDAEKNIEIWKVKKLIKRLEAARGNGTSMISLIIRTCHLDLDLDLHHPTPMPMPMLMLMPPSSQGPDLPRRKDAG